MRDNVKEKTEKPRVRKRKAAQTQNAVSHDRLKILITIVSRKKAEFYLDLIQSHGANMQTVCMAHGTANANMLGLLGLTDNEKAVIFSVISENKLPDTLHALKDKFATIKDGKGVACTIPLTSVIGTLIYGFLSDNKTVVKE